MHSGKSLADFGPIVSNGFLSQTLTTSPGTSYVFDFWLYQNGPYGISNFFEAKFNGVSLMTLTAHPPDVNPTENNYVHYSFNVTATAAVTDIEFTFYNPPAYWI